MRSCFGGSVSCLCECVFCFKIGLILRVVCSFVFVCLVVGVSVCVCPFVAVCAVDTLHVSSLCHFPSFLCDFSC